MRRFLILLIVITPFVISAKKKKGKDISLFSSWGYNRAFFSKSAIHFIGEEYDFTLKSTSAKDRQSPLSAKNYLNLSNLTIPQYNFCLGILLPNDISISIGQDHMKYVVSAYSTAILNGYTHIHDEFEGDYNNQEIVITPDFLQYEHTDGLNYVHVSLNKEKQLLQSNNKNASLSVNIGIHGGLVIPRSDITLMHFERNNRFHVAGYGMGINAGIKSVFLRYCFLKLENKMGYINMPDILTRGIEYSDRAKQAFKFIEFYYSFGVQCPLQMKFRKRINTQF